MKALVLSGGGAKGSFEVGAIGEILKTGIKFDKIYGTSVGALNAAALVSVGYEALLNEWLSIKGPKDIIESKKWQILWRDSVYSTDPLKKKLYALKNFEFCQKTEAIVCSVSLKTGEIRYTSSQKDSKEDFLKHTLASASIPVQMPLIDGEWCDGGVREQTPLRKAILDGATEIWVVLANPILENPDQIWTPKWPKIYSILERTVDCLSHEVKVNDIELCRLKNRLPEYQNVDLHVISPSYLPLDTLDFDPPKLNEFLNHGIERAKEYLLTL